MPRKTKSKKPKRVASPSSHADTPNVVDAPEPARMGAPRKEINYEDFESLCQMHMTEQEVCFYFKIDHKTLNERLMERYGKTFSQVYPELSVGGRVSLRRQLWMLALGSDAVYDASGRKIRDSIRPNAETARFLAKQPETRGGLGMKDAVDNTHFLGNGTYEELIGVCNELEQQKKTEPA
jgi:hypothetical protein